MNTSFDEPPGIAVTGTPHTSVALPYCLNRIAAEVLPVIRGGQVLDAQIDTNNPMRFFRLWRGVRQHHMDPAARQLRVCPARQPLSPAAAGRAGGRGVEAPLAVEKAV